MYEPPPATPRNAPPAPSGPAPSTQWAEYDSTAFIPPHDDFAPPPMPQGVAMPPPGRSYAMYRQPPSWQHASIAGLGDATSDVVTSLLSNLIVIAAGAGLGYFLTGTAKGAGGGALAIVGAVQLPNVFDTGGLTRAAIAAAALGGAYWLLRGDGALMSDYAMRNEDDDGAFEDEPAGRDDVGAKPSDDPSKPAQSAPWLRQVV